MIIEIPFKTPTINHLYGQCGVRKFMKPEAKKLREEIKDIVGNRPTEFLEGKKLLVEVEVHEDWHTKAGLVKRKDIANREKFLIDSIFDAIGVDDKFIFEHIMRKIQSDEEKAIVRIIGMDSVEQTRYKGGVAL